MKRAILLLFVLFITLFGSVLYAADDQPFSVSNVIDSLITSSQNQTFLEMEYYPTDTNTYSITVNMYQVVFKKFSSPDENEALNPEQFFNRDYVPNDLTISIYETENINDKIGECKTSNSKCNLTIDLSTLDENSFNYGCIEIYAEFDGNDYLKNSKSSYVFLCKDKNTKVADAFDKTISDELNKSENQAICITFFIFMGFLVSALYASGGNPLKFFDITTPRLPSSKTKIKFDPNSKDNEVLMGRQALRYIKKNLDNIQNELLFEIEKLARKNFEKDLNEKDAYKGWSQEKKAAEVNNLTKKFMKTITDKLALLLSNSESTIVSETKDLKGAEIVKKEIEIKLDTNNKVKELLDSSLKEVSSTDDYEKLSPRIKQYHKQSTSYVRSELTVDMRSMIVRGSASGKRIGKVRKVIESIPIISGISLGASAILNKNISPEFQILRYATQEVIGSYKKHKAEGKIQKWVNEVEDVNFYNQKSSQNLTEIERIKLEAIKKSRTELRDSLSLSGKEAIETDKAEVLKEIVKQKHVDAAQELKKVKEEFDLLIDALKVSDKDKKAYEKLISILKSKDLKLKDLVKIEDELKKYELPPGAEAEIFEKNKKAILDSYKKLAPVMALNETLADDEKLLSEHKSEGAVATPDTTVNDVVALLALRNLMNELNNIPCLYLKKKIEEKEKFDKEYGELVAKFNPSERYDQLYQKAVSLGVTKEDLDYSQSLKEQISKLKYSKSDTTGYIEGYKEILDFTDSLVKKHDFIELGIMDTLQDQKAVVSRYLETYGAFDADLDGKRLSSVLKDKGFDAAVKLIIEKIGSEEDISKMFGADASHATKMEERTEHNKSIYALYINFYEDFEENLSAMGKTVTPEDESRMLKLKEFYADSMSEIYEEGTYQNPEQLSRIFTPGVKLTESEANLKERSEKVFDVLKNGLKLDDDLQKEIFIKNLKLMFDSASIDTTRIRDEMEKGLHTELLKELSGKSITNKWLHDSSVRRAQAITVNVGLRENILKLRDYVEDNVITYNNLVDRVTELNNEKRDKIILLNHKLGNVVENTSNLSGQEIFAQTSIQMLKVLSDSFDQYFRETFEKPRMEYLKKEFGELILKSSGKVFNEELTQDDINNGLTLEQKKKTIDEEKKKELDKLSPHIIYDIVEGRFERVRGHPIFNDLSDAYLKKIQTNLTNMTYSNMYNRILYRGWEAEETNLINELKTVHNIDIKSNYDLYDLLDGKNPKLSTVRESLLKGHKNTYDLMRSKGVEFLVGGNDPKNLEEVYYLYKAYNKFSAEKNEPKLLEIVSKQLELRNMKHDKVTTKNVKSFFDLVGHDGLLLQGMELTAEGERRFGWYVDIKSNYNPLYELGTRKRAFKILSSTFEPLLKNSYPEGVDYNDMNLRMKYVSELKAKLQQYDNLSIDEIERQLQSRGVTTSPVLARNILKYKEFLTRYEDAKDYVPSYKTVGITGKAVNVKLSDTLIEQEDGIERRVIVPCDEDSKIRKFSYDLQNEVNRCFVTFPMIGLMSESVSTFNTIFRSKDYVAEALENYKSFSTTNINDLLRNEKLAKLVSELYQEKWALENMCKNRVEDIPFNGSKFEKQILGEIKNTLEVMRKEISTYFVLKIVNDQFDDAVVQKRDELNYNITNETNPDKKKIYQKELDFLNLKYDEYVLSSKKLNELEKIIPSTIEKITIATKNARLDDVTSNFNKIIDGLSPFAGEYHVKDTLEDYIGKRGYYIEAEQQKIENLRDEIKFYSSIEKKIVSEIKSKFKDIPKSMETEFIIKHLEGLSKTLKKGPELDFVNDKITQLNNLKDVYEKVNISIKNSEDKIFKISNTIKNKDDWAKVKENHLNKAKLISDSDIKFDKLFRTSSILFENFINSYEGLYKTRNLSTHTRRVAYGLPGNEYGGTQFAGPISSTPLQYFGTLGQTGNMGWFSVLATSFMFNKIDKLYKKRFALNYLFSDVPLITSPMGVSSRLQISKYYKIKFGIMRSKFGEFLEPNPNEKPAPSLTLLSSLFSRNIRGERRLSELIDFMGGSYAGTPKGARDVINYLLYKPNAMKMDFKDKVFTLQDSRSMKKSSEFLYDVGIYAPFTNNAFIAGREITLFNDLYYNQTSVSTFYPNRAMNLISSAPHYANPKYRNMAYAGNYKFSQSQLDLVEESVGYTDLGKTPMWNSLSIPLFPLLVGTSGLPFVISLLGFGYMTGLKNAALSGTRSLAIHSINFFRPEDYYVKKYMLYSSSGIYSSIYNDYNP